MTALTPVTSVSRSLPLRIETLLLRAFAIPVERPATDIVIAVARICFGLLMLHRALLMAPFAISTGDPALLQTATTIIGLSALAIIFGLATPIALVVMLITVASGATSYYVGMQVAVIICWVLLFLGAGRFWGVDGPITRRFPGYDRTLYFLSPYLTVRRLALIRCLALLLYASVTFTGGMYHISDPLWSRGLTLPFALMTPNVSAHPDLFTTIWQAQPGLFSVASIAILFVQTIWEIFMFPLMFFRLGRLFVALHGVGFFVFSGILMFLGYVPTLELCLWALIFAYPAFWLREKHADRNQPPLVANRGRVSRGALIGFTVLCTVVLTEFNIAHIRAALYWQTNPAVPAARDIERPYALSLIPDRLGRRLLGQQPSAILAEMDLASTRTYPVIAEVDANNVPIRVVGLMSHKAERLSMFQNETISYLVASSPFTMNQPPVWNENSPLTIAKVVVPDYCKQHGLRSGDDVNYRVYLFSRDLDQSGSVSQWVGDPRLTEVQDADLTGVSSAFCNNTFDLLPEITLGLRPDDQTRAETLAALRDYAANYPGVAAGTNAP